MTKQISLKEILMQEKPHWFDEIDRLKFVMDTNVFRYAFVSQQPHQVIILAAVYEELHQNQNIFLQSINKI